MDGMIRGADIEDLNEILALQKKAFGPVAADVGADIPPMAQTYDSIAGEYQKSRFIKYTLDGKIVGSVRGYLDDENRCQVCRLIVDPGYQNRGIGKRLMRALEEAFPDCDGYALFTGSESYNDKTIALYKKLGYTVTSEKPLGGVPMVFMDKPNELRVRRAGECDLNAIHGLYNLATAWLNGQGIRQWDTNVYPTYETARIAWESGELYCIGRDPVVATVVLNEEQQPEYSGIMWKYPGKALVIHTLMVHPEYTRQGLGKRLLAYADQLALAWGYDCIRVAIYPDNAAAMVMYKKAGYEFAGEIVFAFKEPGTQVYHCYEKKVGTAEREVTGMSMVIKKGNTLPVRSADKKDLAAIHQLYYAATAWLNAQGIHQWNTDVYPTYETARRAWEDGHLYCIGADPVAATMVLNDIQPEPYGGVTWKYPGRAMVIHTLVVHPEYTGLGLGRRLLHFAENEAAEKGYDCIRIDVFPDNPAAMKLYKWYGFEYAGEIVFEFKEPGFRVYHCYEMRI